MQSFYDQQIVSSDQRSTFSPTIGGPRTDAKGAWIDPTANGGDDQGYPNFRVYKPAGTTTLPNVTYTARGALPSTLTSCSSMSSYLRAAIARADKAHPGKGQTVGQSARHNLWPNNTNPFHDWSILNRPAHVGRAPKRCLGPAAYPTGRP